MKSLGFACVSVAVTALALFGSGWGSGAEQGALVPGARYVAMGSSFASGPGVAPSADAVPARCGRSAANYAQQFARKRGLALTDVSCSGAQSAHVLEAWGDLAGQLDALTPATALVTLTIGGNDIGYIGGLINASCAFVAAQSGGDQSQGACRAVTQPTVQDYKGLEARMMAIAAQVRARAPKAKLIFVTYAAVLPPEGLCAATPVSAQQAKASRAIARTLDAITANVAAASGAALLDAASITRDHHACAAEPWMQGYVPEPDWVRAVPYHPTREGMTAIAQALDGML